MHDILKVEPWVEDAPDAVCVTGRRACPPEDVGGIWGDEDLLAVLRGEASEQSEAQELLEWLPDGFDPGHFDADEINDALGRESLDLARRHPALASILARGGAQFGPVAELVANATTERVVLTEEELDAATGSFRILLDAVGAGVQLTQAGYLSPALVKRVLDGLGPDLSWPFAAGREADTDPVLNLREAATALGLLRK